jgi:hypothetical protein
MIKNKLFIFGYHKEFADMALDGSRLSFEKICPLPKGLESNPYGRMTTWGCNEPEITKTHLETSADALDDAYLEFSTDYIPFGIGVALMYWEYSNRSLYWIFQDTEKDGEDEWHELFPLISMRLAELRDKEQPFFKRVFSRLKNGFFLAFKPFTN